MIKVVNLIKKFDKAVEPSLKGISFEISKGEIVGLFGENGAGKTTIFRLLSTMLKPTIGKIIINDIDIIKYPQKIRKQLGVLFSGEDGLYERLTGKENIEYFAKLNDISKESLKIKIKEISDLLNIKNYYNKKVGIYSKGMKQKISIARAVIHDPEILLLDEPTTGLDITSSLLMQSFIKEFKRHEKTIMISSHNIQELDSLCDRVIILHKGILVEDIDKKTIPFSVDFKKLLLESFIKANET